MVGPPPFNFAVGRAIRRIRRDREMSQDQLAQRAGLSAKHLGEIERGQKDPRTNTVAAVIERGFEMDFRTFAEVCDRLRQGTAIPRELTINAGSPHPVLRAEDVPVDAVPAEDLVPAG